MTYSEAEVKRLMNYAARAALKSLNPDYEENVIQALQPAFESLRWDLREGRGPSSNPPPSPLPRIFSEGGGVQKEAPLTHSIVVTDSGSKKYVSGCKCDKCHAHLGYAENLGPRGELPPRVCDCDPERCTPWLWSSWKEPS